MIPGIAGFLVGDLLLQTVPALPSKNLCVVLLGLGIGCYWCVRHNRITSIVLASMFAGFLFSAWAAQSRLTAFPVFDENVPLRVTGYIASIPHAEFQSIHFLFSVGRSKIALSWKHPPRLLRVGDQWTVWMLLRHIHDVNNYPLPDADRLFFQKKILGKGTVLDSSESVFHKRAWFLFPITSFRAYYYTKLAAYPFHNLPWLSALLIGEHFGAAQQAWQILRQTGTNHLMAVAGLHMGWLFGMTQTILNQGWRLFPSLLLWMPAQLAGMGVAYLVALGYGIVTGFALPAQRVSLMLLLWILSRLMRIRVNPWSVWWVALLLVLLMDPLAVLTDSFWLSFGTIGLLIYGLCGRLSPYGWWWHFGRAQWVIAVGLLPLSLILFQQGSLVAFFANFFAIPWLSFCILPFCVLGGALLCIFPTVGAGCLWVADQGLSILWRVLDWFAQWPMTVQACPSLLAVGISVIGVLCLLSPVSIRIRSLGVFLLLPCFVHAESGLLKREIRLTILDVGQGLSVLVQTAHHVLIFDTGPKTQSVDMGARIVLPTLYQMGLTKLDVLVISHGDNDHAGGAHAILSAFPVAAIKTSVPKQFAIPVTSSCIEGERWEWDGVLFEFLNPPLYSTIPHHNNTSCVLRISSGDKHVLLTGDIEYEAENRLLREHFMQLPATILIAPHHGSQTSGVPAFINAVHPQFVVYAVGYHNRYHFPHPAILKAYAQIGAIQLNTAQSGAITFHLIPSKPLLFPQQTRLDHPHYWESPAS